MIKDCFSRISTRRISDVTEALRDTAVSASKRPRLNQKVYVRLEAFINRP